MKKILLIPLFLLTTFQLPAQLELLLEGYSKNANHIKITESKNFEIISQKKIIESYTSEIMVLSEASPYRSYSISYNDLQKITKLSLIVKDLSGQILQEYKKKDFENYPSFSSNLYDDYRKYYVDLQKFSPPYIVEVSSSKERKGAFYLDDFFPRTYAESVIHSEISVSHPEDIEINYKVFNSDSAPHISIEGDIHHLRWQQDSLKAIAYEALGPSSYNFFPYISISPKNFHYDGYDGSMDSWDSYNEFYHRINQDRDALSAEFKTYILKSTKDLSSDKEKIDFLYTYLKENVRYVSVQLGIGGWQTYDASYVEQNKYGDCKALSNFMGAMLKTVDIQSQKVILYRGVYGYRQASKNFVNLPFNHAILYLPREEMFLECTSNNYSPGYLGLDNANREVMISAKEGPKFMNTPTMGEEENIAYSFSEISLKQDGSAVISDSIILKGGLHDELRYYADKKTANEKSEDFIDNFPLSIQSLAYRNIHIKPDAPELELTYQVSVNKYGSKAGKRFFIPLNPIHQVVSTPVEVENRKLPFTSHLAATYENEILIKLPDGYKVESMTRDNFKSESRYGEYTFSSKIENSVVKIYTKWISKTVTGTAEEYESYRDELKKINGFENSMIVLVKKKT